jgi:two-component system, chemotaxis family, chemotaxis protein CheY
MKKVLIVDDSAFTRNIHKSIFQTAGWQTIEAANGAEALAQFTKEQPDLVLLDLLLPDIDGMEAAKAILNLEPSANIAICSTDKQKYRKQQAQEIGAREFFTKPVEAPKLLAFLRENFSL